MSGREIGTIAGALIVGYLTAGTGLAAYGTAIGGIAGGAIGGAIDGPTKTFGPRLDDLKVQFSSFGAGIPTLYGTERYAGNVIWSTDKLQVSSVTSSGKGGGTQNTSYKYYVWMSLLLGETPRDGSTVSIVKFLQDGKLIWDASSGIPIGSALASAENPYSSFVLFQGHQDQLPDPIEEAFTGGPGSCSAYRGVVRIRMNAIECPDGRVPQFSFVLSNSATQVNQIYDGSSFTIGSQYVTASRLGADSSLFSNDASIGVYSASLNYCARSLSVGRLPSLQGGQPAAGDADIDAICLRENVFGDTGNNHFIDQTGAETKVIAVGTDCLVDGRTYSSWSKRGDNLLIASSYPTDQVKLFTWSSGALVSNVSITGQQKVICTDNYGWVFDGTNLQIRTLDASFTQLAIVTTPTITSAHGPHLCYGPNDKPYFILNTNFDTKIYSATYAAGAITFTLVYDITRADASIPYPLQDPVSVVGTNLYGFTTQVTGGATPNTVLTPAMIALAQYAAQPVKVKDIFADQCERAGVTTYDVSGIPDSDTVIGYKIANPASARANIEPLLTLIGGYVVDEDGVTKFKKYADIASVASVTFDELGQAEGDAAGEAMPLNRTQEIDLPRSVTTTYIEATSDYQTASETEVRQVTDATEDAQIQLPVCVTSDQAKKVSQMVLYDRWRRQNTRSVTVSRKYAFVSPGDGVTVEYPRGTFKLWLVLSTNDTGAVCEWSLCPGDAAIFTRTATGSTGYVSQDVAPLAAPLRAQILNIPPLRDEDNNAGPYVALDSYASVPADGALLVGDDDNTLQSRGTVSASAPIGFAETAGASWSSITVDEKSTFTVNLGDDVFTSVTRDVLLSGGAEYWAYGADGRWEIGAAAQGDSLGSGRYILSRHLRGLFGTERFIGTQQAGDTFVLLRIAGMLRPDTGVGGIGQTKSYRAIAKGRSNDSATSQTYANTGEGLTPLSPINLRRTDTNDFTVDRRSRMAMNNSTGAVPIGEASEHFTWEFYNSGTYATLLGTVVTNTGTVTAAQITAIGVTPSAPAFLKVRQVSDSIGPGHELQATA